jgi:O-antigen/teichoic acid export membrane protein
MVLSDRFVIGALLDVKAAGVYAVPFQLAQRSTILSSAFSSALFPKFSAGALVESQEIAQRSVSTLCCAMLPFIVAGIFLITPFIAWWVSPDFAGQASLVGEILLVAFWFNALASVPHSLLHGSGRPFAVAVIHSIELPIYFLLLYFAVVHSGLLGAASVFALRVFVDSLALSYVAKIPLWSSPGVAAYSALVLLAMVIRVMVESGTVMYSVLAVGVSALAVLAAYAGTIDSVKAQFPGLTVGLSVTQRKQGD